MNADGDPDIFCGYFSWELEEHPENDYGMGVTNVVETGQDKGIIFFVKNYRPAGETHLVGSGVAAVDTSGSHPTCRRTAEYWWSADDEPQFGGEFILRLKASWLGTLYLFLLSEHGLCQLESLMNLSPNVHVLDC